MEVYILNTNLEIIATIDEYRSLIWTPRFNTCGDFELYVPATETNIKLLKKRYYVMRSDDTSKVAVIEKVKINQDAENGDYITASGRDASSILWRRIVWLQTTYSGPAERVIRRMITSAFLDPEIADRAVTNLKLGSMIGDTEKIKMQFTGDVIGDAIVKICQEQGLGFRTLFDRATNKFTFSLYKGTDRSYNQSARPFVVFSEDFDNLLSSTYTDDGSVYKNVARIGGEGQGIQRVMTQVGSATGLNRYETFINAATLSSNKGELSSAEYKNILKQKAKETLAGLKTQESMEAQIEPNFTYTLGKDYELGDIVEIVDEYGHQAAVRITEIIESWGDTGYSCIPHFSAI